MRGVQNAENHKDGMLLNRKPPYLCPRYVSKNDQADDFEQHKQMHCGIQLPRAKTTHLTAPILLQFSSINAILQCTGLRSRRQ